ncbi:MAG: polysaccharide deacetylase family protein [Vicinamibacterales bacterium]
MFALALILIGGLVALTHTAPFPFLLEAFRPGDSLWRVKQPAGAPPAIYLTFDDGPNPAWTPALLDALKEQDVHATFFLIDRHITPETAPIVKRIAAEGHAIALHTGNRRPMVTAPRAFAADLRRQADRIASISGAQPCRLFRPHAGWRSGAMYEGLEQAGFTLAGWSWGMWDWDWWRTPNAERVAARLLRKASAGDIVVIHDGHHRDPRADRRHAAGTVRLLVPRLRQRGFVFLRLCDS